jgi:hypothetical protein
MGAIDHLVLAMGISLSAAQRRDAVALLTSGARMARAGGGPEPHADGG